MKESWDIINNWLIENAKEIHEDLNIGISQEQINIFLKKIDFQLPESYINFLQIHNGQKGNSAYLLEDWLLLDLESVIETWSSLKKTYNQILSEDYDPNLGWKDKWLPIGSNESGDYLCIDLDTNQKEQYGRMIEFYHTEEEIIIIKKSFKEYIKGLASDFKNNLYQYIDIEFEERISKINS